MGIFDKMFGRGSSDDDQERFNELKGKYHQALVELDKQQVQLRKLQLKDDKLFLQGIAPSEQAKNEVWDEIKKVDNDWNDEVTADIRVSAMPTVSGTAAAAAGTTAPKSYTVQPGDTLSKISREHYGDSNEYMRIFYANRDKLNDPDQIQAGQQLVIPPDDDQ